MDSQKKTAIGGAIGVMVLLLIVGLWPKADQQAPSATKAGEKKGPISALTKSSGIASAIPRRKTIIEPGERPQTSIDPYNEWELKKILSHFMVPPGRFEAANISEAMEMLEAIYAEHSDGRMLDIQVKAASTSSASFAFDHGNISFRQLLDIVGAIAGYEIGVGDAKVAFLASGEPVSDDTFVVLPDDFAASDRGDPFAEGDRFIDLAAARARFEQYGIVFDEDSGVAYSEELGGLIFSHRPEQLRQIRALDEALRVTHADPQVFMTHKIVKAHNGATIETGTLRDADFMTMMRALNQRDDVEITSAPSIVTRGGQKAKVEIIREAIYPTDTDATGTPSAFGMIPVGMSIPITPVMAGLDRVQLNGATEFTGFHEQTLTEIMGNGSGPTSPPRTDILSADSFATHANDFSGQLYDGNTTVILAAEETATGTSVYHLMTVRRIDPSGQPLLQP